MPAHVHPIIVYYEDTDLTGAVYHANYLRFMERAREHMFGVRELVQRLENGLGFVVYRCDLTFREPAVHGDHLEIHSTVKQESPVRLVFTQRVRRGSGGKDLVVGKIDLVPVDASGRLVPVPADLLGAVAHYRTV
ncbi:MAG: acyl-CoA thioester hydrolase [Kiritimatiellia bacterium]|jgi:acyl-CoA thioester hydrolase